MDLHDCGINCYKYDSLVEMICRNYDTKNEKKEELRGMSFLDEFRNENFPDDVAVVIFSENLQPEQVWVRCMDVTEEMLYGTLLNEPNQDYGVHMGDKIGFVPIERPNGMLLVSHVDNNG